MPAGQDEPGGLLPSWDPPMPTHFRLAQAKYGIPGNGSPGLVGAVLHRAVGRLPPSENGDKGYEVWRTGSPALLSAFVQSASSISTSASSCEVVTRHGRSASRRFSSISRVRCQTCCHSWNSGP